MCRDSCTASLVSSYNSIQSSPPSPSLLSRQLLKLLLELDTSVDVAQ